LNAPRADTHESPIPWRRCCQTPQQTNKKESRFRTATKAPPVPAPSSIALVVVSGSFGAFFASVQKAPDGICDISNDTISTLFRMASAY